MSRRVKSERKKESQLLMIHGSVCPESASVFLSLLKGAHGVGMYVLLYDFVESYVLYTSKACKMADFITGTIYSKMWDAQKKRFFSFLFTSFDDFESKALQ